MNIVVGPYIYIYFKTTNTKDISQWTSSSHCSKTWMVIQLTLVLVPFGNKNINYKTPISATKDHKPL